jgi:thiol-disulfide isomerase/thioredoxin
MQNANCKIGESQRSGSVWPLVLLIVLAAVTLLTIQMRRPRTPDPLLGRALPPLEIGGWLNADKPLSTDDLRGKVVLIDFWSTDCPTCVLDMPELVEFHARFRDSGLVVIGLTPESDAAGQLARFVDDTAGLAWPIGYGAGFVFELMGVRATPTYVLYDRTGRSVWAGHSLDGAEDAAIKALAVGG